MKEFLKEFRYFIKYLLVIIVASNLISIVKSQYTLKSVQVEGIPKSTTLCTAKYQLIISVPLGTGLGLGSNVSLSPNGTQYKTYNNNVQQVSPANTSLGYYLFKFSTDLPVNTPYNVTVNLTLSTLNVYSLDLGVPLLCNFTGQFEINSINKSLKPIKNVGKLGIFQIRIDNKYAAITPRWLPYASTQCTPNVTWYQCTFTHDPTSSWTNPIFLLEISVITVTEGVRDYAAPLSVLVQLNSNYTNYASTIPITGAIYEDSQAFMFFNYDQSTYPNDYQLGYISTTIGATILQSLNPRYPIALVNYTSPYTQVCSTPRVYYGTPAYILYVQEYLSSSNVTIDILFPETRREYQIFLTPINLNPPTTPYSFIGSLVKYPSLKIVDLVYSKSDYSPITITQTGIDGGSHPILTPFFPIGISKLTYNPTMNLNYSYALPSNYFVINVNSINWGVNISQAISNDPLGLSTPPLLNDIKLIPLTWRSYIVRMVITDYNGVDYIMFNDQLFGQETLASGSLTNGVFMFVYQLPMKPIAQTQPKIVIYSTGGQFFDSTPNYFYNFAEAKVLPIQPFSYYYNLNYNNIKSIKFVPNNIDTFNVSQVVNMYMVIDNPSPSYQPYIRILLSQDLNTDAQRWVDDIVTVYDPSSNQYISTFTLVPFMPPKSIYYEINGRLNSDVLNNQLGSQSQLNVTSSYFDNAGPIITNVNANQVTKDILITINDQIGGNGLKEGWISIYSDQNQYPLTVRFNESNLQSGNISSGVYKIQPFLNYNYSLICANQTWFIGSVKLVDRGGWINQYPPTSQYPTPAFTSMSSATTPLYTTNCTTGVPLDTTLPTINSVFVPVGRITNGFNNQLQFELRAQDNVGMTTLHNPMAMMADFYGNYIIGNLTIVSITNPTAFYNYKFDIPYNFGVSNGLWLTFHGIMDTTLNMVSGTGAGVNGVYIIVDPDYLPYLNKSIGLIDSEGGNVTITGKWFGDSIPNLTTNTNQNVVLRIQEVDHIYMIVQVFQMDQSIQSFTFQVTVNGTYTTNTITIPIQPTPTPSPTPTPPTCPLNCMNRGNCTIDGCQCQSSWFGPSCESTIIPVPRPNANSTDPTIIIDGGNNSTNSSNNNPSIYSIISITSIREIDYDKTLIKDYVFDKWVFTDQSNSSTLQGGAKYNYISTLSNTTSTTVNVTIEWFPKSTIIQYAGESISMPPYSTKISIGLSSYTFSNSLSTLQLILNVSINQQLNGDCDNVNSQYGSGGGGGSSQSSITDIQWIRLNVNDQSLYGRFIKRGIIDNRIVSVTNELIGQSIEKIDANQSTTSLQSMVAINIPQYSNNVFLDPDFSNLFNVDNGSNGCQNKGLSIGAISGIVVGSVVGAAVIGTVTAWKLKSNRFKRNDKKIQIRLESIDK